MAKNNIETLDDNHEIEEFLQKYIVEKVIDGYEVDFQEVKSIVDQLQKGVNSIKNISNTTSEDISALLKNNSNANADIEEKLENIRKIVKKIEVAKNDICKSIVKEEKIAELISQGTDNSLQSIINPVYDDLKENKDSLDEIISLLHELSENLNMLKLDDKEIMDNCTKLMEQSSDACKQLSTINEGLLEINRLINQSNVVLDNSKNEILRSNKTIAEGVSSLNQKIKFLWITVGIDTFLVLILMIMFFYR